MLHMNLNIWLNALFTQKGQNVNMEVHPEGELNRLAVLRFLCAFQTPYAVWIPGTAVMNNTSIILYRMNSIVLFRFCWIDWLNVITNRDYAFANVFFQWEVEGQSVAAPTGKVNKKIDNPRKQPSPHTPSLSCPKSSPSGWHENRSPLVVRVRSAL